MKSYFNLHLLEFSLFSLIRRGTKNSFIFVIFTGLIFLLSSVLFISEAIKHELNSVVEGLPEITLQRLQAGRQVNTPIERAEALLDIEGVQSALPRIWGYYYFKSAGVNFSVVGIDAFEESYKHSLTTLIEHTDIKTLEKAGGMLVGKGVKAVLEENHYQDFFNFVTSEGTWQRIPIMGVFESSVALESNDIILLPKSIAYAIFGMNKHEATDIVVRVANPREIATVVEKITERYPDMRALTKDDIRVSYQNIFDYKSGFFLALFVISAFTFFIIIFDKVSGLSSEEKREIGILKALGWSSSLILKERFYEAFILSALSFILGIIISMVYVFFLDAPVLKDIFTGYSQLKPAFSLPFYANSAMFILLFFLSVPIYVAAVLIPSWKASIHDADEVMR